MKMRVAGLGTRRAVSHRRPWRAQEEGGLEHTRGQARVRLARRTRREAAGPSDAETTTVGTEGDAQERLSQLATFLEEDLTHLFDERGIDKSVYADNVKFEDPITKYSSIDGYLLNINMLKNLFSVSASTFRKSACACTNGLTPCRRRSPHLSPLHL